MHPYYKSFLQSKNKLDQELVVTDIQTETHLIEYLLQNQKLPGKYRSRDFNPSYNLQDSMDMLEYVYPEYYIEIISKKDEHEVKLKSNILNDYITKKSKWLAKSIFMAMVQDFHDTYNWPQNEIDKN